MTITRLTLSDWRNYTAADVVFHPRVNLIRGDNAAGKTNLIEAVYYLSTLRAARPGRERDLIRHGQPYARVSAVLNDAAREQEASIRIAEGARRHIEKNGVEIRRAADYIGSLRTVLFSPEDLSVLKDGAAKRRRLLDMAICQLRPRYLAHLSAYNRLLEQKSKALRALEEKPSLREMLPVYNEEMAVHAGEIIAARYAYIEQLAGTAARLAEAASGGKDVLALRYETLSNIPDLTAGAAALAARAAEHQEKHRDAELAARVCLSGPHRDELAVTVNGKPARMFASQGQLRTAVLAIKLAERDIVFRETGEYPVLLLDDVLSELDAERQTYFLNNIREGQVIMTSCTVDQFAVLGRGRVHTVHRGAIQASADATEGDGA